MQTVLNNLNRFSTRVRKCTRPLHDHLGVTFFSYQHIDAAGDYRTLGDRIDWSEHYFAVGLHQKDPLWKHPSLIPAGVRFASGLVDETRLTAREKYGIGEAAVLCYRKPDAVEIFGFALDPAASGSQDYLANTLPLLQEYTRHFREQFPDLHEEVEPINLVDQCGKDFFHSPADYGPAFETSQRDDFLKALGHGPLIKRASTLTPREQEVLRILASGHTMGGIAEKLRLSPKTIEHYLEKCKNKLTCFSMSELRQCAVELVRLNLLVDSIS